MRFRRPFGRARASRPRGSPIVPSVGTVVARGARSRSRFSGKPPRHPRRRESPARPPVEPTRACASTASSSYLPLTAHGASAVMPASSAATCASPAAWWPASMSLPRMFAPWPAPSAAGRHPTAGFSWCQALFGSVRHLLDSASYQIGRVSRFVGSASYQIGRVSRVSVVSVTRDPPRKAPADAGKGTAGQRRGIVP